MRFRILRTVLLAASMAICHPAFAQFQKAHSTLSMVSTGLMSLGVVLLTISLIWAAIKMMFHGASIKDLGPIFTGGILAGSASTIAGLIIS